MKKTISPTTISGIKSLAKDLKKELGTSHADALNKAAGAAGYNNYAHAKNVLSAKTKFNSMVPFKTGGFPDGLIEYQSKSLRAWGDALEAVNQERDKKIEVTNPKEIVTMLSEFVGNSLHHAYLPGGGGQDIEEVRLSKANDCIELVVHEGPVYLVRPSKLILELVAAAPGESFLLLELTNLPDSFVQNASFSSSIESISKQAFRQEFLRAGDIYYPRDYWDAGTMGVDADGSEIPIPRTAEIVVLWNSGKLLFVSKGSLWNNTSSTYDGRHTQFSSTQIREIIEGAVDKFLADAA